jgi:HEAT repeat protein
MAITDLIKDLYDPDLNKRRIAASQIGENASFADKQWIEINKELLQLIDNETDDEVRSELIWTLGEITANNPNLIKQNMDKLISILKNKQISNDVRISTANALGRLGDITTFEQLQSCFKDMDENEEIHNICFIAIDEISHKIQKESGEEEQYVPRSVSHFKANLTSKIENFFRWVSQKDGSPELRLRGEIALKLLLNMETENGNTQSCKEGNI